MNLVKTVISKLSGDLRTGNALANLAIARGGLLDDAITPVYLRQLEDLDPLLITRACVQLANQPRADYETTLPSVGTIRALVETLAREDQAKEAAKHLLPLPDPDSDQPTFFCLDCHDESSAWREMFCTGASTGKQLDARPLNFKTPVYYCGRKFAHGPHGYVERCPCYETNPVIARRREQSQRYGKAKGA